MIVLEKIAKKKKLQRMIDIRTVIQEKVYASTVEVTTRDSRKKNTTFGLFSLEIDVITV